MEMLIGTIAVQVEKPCQAQMTVTRTVQAVTAVLLNTYRRLLNTYRRSCILSSASAANNRMHDLW